MMGDQPGDGVQPYHCDHPDDGGAFLGLGVTTLFYDWWPSWAWCLTILEIVWDPYFENGWSSFEKLATIFLMVDDHPGYGWWPAWGRWVTIYGSCHLMLFLLVKFKFQILRLQYFSFRWVTILGMIEDHPWQFSPILIVLWIKYKCQNPSL